MRYALFFFALLTVRAFAQSVDIPNASSFYCAQRMPNWCWAACNQMLLNSQDIPVTQEEQVVKLFGALVDRGAGATYNLAARALTGSYVDANGTPVQVTAYVSTGSPDDPADIVDYLARGVPLVMATRMHGRVCIGVDYLSTPQGVPYQITVLRLLDPMDPSRIVVKTIQQFNAEGLMGFMALDVQ